ncbi:(d)CMP kinase [Tissierella sp. Yu-01]|uniref:(d)CMP kinase n=1 Tax=Tissierella sp. Yu-01 TaxID=3035694 RepID=UPI00240DED89|nr:(d)CMP kinase [Tissierella sp. Yu-01]WFA09721.1 (d)CMP kinase [Tissierella sp. Yu-01]
MKKEFFSIAIDGPAGAGKSTIAKKTAQVLGIEYIDTGAMYRALTLKVLRNKIDPLNYKEIISLLSKSDIDFNDNHIYLDGVLVDDEIRENKISKNVSYIAVIKEVREIMVSLQQKLATRKSVIMDGRDITTVVLPNADYKFFVTASVEERSRRRYKELIEKGEIDVTLEKIMEDIRRRDEIDSTREVAPLKMTSDSYLLDTTNKTIDECVDFIVSIVKGRS